MTESLTRRHRQLVRFALLGGSNTAVTGAALALLARIISPTVAYTIVFLMGLAVATTFTGRFVFRSQLTPRRALAFCLMYGGVYGIGILVIHVAPNVLGDSKSLLAISVVLITSPLSFLGGRLIFDAHHDSSGDLGAAR